jgi:hypothetical protein
VSRLRPMVGADAITTPLSDARPAHGVRNELQDQHLRDTFHPVAALARLLKSERGDGERFSERVL